MTRMRTDLRMKSVNNPCYPRLIYDRMLSRLFLLFFLPLPLFAQTTQEKVRDYRRSNEHQILKEFTTLLSIPNVAADTQNIRKNAALILEMMKQHGLNPRLLEGPTPNTPPAVYGEWKTPG